MECHVAFGRAGLWFDDENTIKHEWVGRGPDGFPVFEGRTEDILGKNFEIRCAAFEPEPSEEAQSCLYHACLNRQL